MSLPMHRRKYRCVCSQMDSGAFGVHDVSLVCSPSQAKIRGIPSSGGNSVSSRNIKLSLWNPEMHTLCLRKITRKEKT